MIFSAAADTIGIASDELPTTGWTFEASSTNANNGVPTEVPENVIDGTPEKHWHSMVKPKAEGPHWITIILPEAQKIGGLRYTPRANMCAGNCQKYEIRVSNDNKKFEKVAEGTWIPNADTKTAMFTKDVTAKYVKLIILEGVGGFGSAGELRLVKAGSGAAGTPNASTGSTGSTGSASTGTTNTNSSNYVELSTAGWTFEASSTNANNGVPSEVPENVIDGTPEKHWHSMINPKAEGPHWITIVLPTTQKIGGLKYTPRANMCAGNCKKYEIRVSMDNVNFEKVAEGEWVPDAETKTAIFTKPVEARFVKLVILDGVGGFGSAGEIRLLGPKGADSAVSNVKEIDKELPTTGWTFLTSSTNANNGVPAEIPEKVIDGDPATHWHSMINPKAGEPHWITIVLPNEQEIGGYRYTPRASGEAGVCTDYEIYASNDNVNFEKLAAGKWDTGTDAKTVYFVKNVKAKYVRLEIVHGVYGFGSAGELRLMVPNPKKKTEALNATIKLDSTQNDNKAEEPDAGVELPQTGWTVKASSVNTQDDGVTPRESDQKLIDGDLTTYWHSKISPKDPAPFEVLLTLPEVTSVSGFRYYPRQDGGAGICTKFELHASADGKTFYKMDEGTWENNTKAKTISFVGNVKVKAFKFIILDGTGGFGSGGELKLLEAKTGLDTIDVSKYEELKKNYLLSAYMFDGMKIHTPGETNLIAHRMADGEKTSFWYSASTVNGSYVTIDYEFPYPYTLKGIRYLGRQDGREAGNFLKIKVEKSIDAKTYESVGEFTIASAKNVSKDIYFDKDVAAKYIKITVLESKDNYAACADIYFLQNGKTHEEEIKKDEEKYVLKIGSGEIKVTKEGAEKTVTIDAAPYIYNGSTMIPLRGLLEEMGCTVGWAGETETITVNSVFDEMKFGIENPAVTINSVRYNCPVAPQITNSRTYIPLRFVSENLGYNVYWNGETEEITISTK